MFFNLELNSNAIFVIGVFFTAGLFFGWLCRKGNLVMMLLALILFSTLFQWMIAVDLWFVTIPFVLGVAVYTAKPLFRRINR